MFFCHLYNINQHLILLYFFCPHFPTQYAICLHTGRPQVLQDNIFKLLILCVEKNLVKKTQSVTDGRLWYY